MTPSEMKAAADALESRVLAETDNVMLAIDMSHMIDQYTQNVYELTLAVYRGHGTDQIATLSALVHYRRAALLAKLMQFDPTKLSTTH